MFHGGRDFLGGYFPAFKSPTLPGHCTSPTNKYSARGLHTSTRFYHSLTPHREQRLGVQTHMVPLMQQRGFASKKHKRIIKMAKGYRGRANRCFRIAIRRVEKALQYAYRDRKVKRREMRKLWIQRLNAGVRQHGISYSKFIPALHKSGVILNRKVLADIASNEPFSFKAVVDVVKMRAESAR